MARARSSSAEFLLRTSSILKALGHPVRLETVKLLRDGERSVADIQRHLDLIQSVTSQHLRLMDRKGILRYRHQGTMRYYSIADEFIHKILDCFTACEGQLRSGDREQRRARAQAAGEKGLKQRFGESSGRGEGLS